jgi:hypothetical protein
MRRILFALSLFLLTSAGTCDDDPASPDSVVGTYALASIDGDALPASIGAGTQDARTVTAGSMTLNANNTFSFSETSSAGTDAVSGTWTLSGSTITFDPSEPGDTNATAVVSGNTLSLTTEEGVMVFNKQ